MKKITVLIIAYNQEKIIAKTLDSILCQKEWGLYQIIVGDDCSKDHTWDVLVGYQSQYPDIIKAYRNEHNLGIYENFERVISRRGDGDLYTMVAGDDPICNGYFRAIQQLIIDKEIDTEKAIGIYSDWKTVDIKGKEVIYRQNKVLGSYPLWSLYIRGIITSRSLMFSKLVIDGFKPVIKTQGLNLAESLFDSQVHQLIKKAYYLPVVTSSYRLGIGISTKLGKTDYYTKQNIIKWQYYLDHFVTTPKDRFYSISQIVKGSYYEKPSIVKFFKVLYCYFRGQFMDCLSIRKILIEFGEMIKYAFSK